MPGMAQVIDLARQKDQDYLCAESSMKKAEGCGHDQAQVVADPWRRYLDNLISMAQAMRLEVSYMAGVVGKG